ncbi:olfactory receptor 6C74-like [Bombina bombina]|uniref:olfactory receptor 6C74-like n=1 Tax=Bombina bombina TaxID=8345 RepID=UPI00235ADE6F|nr:olfactory receptor 6C74-like [Bombina bombina]
MDHSNYTITYFILKGISDHPALQAPIFFLILLTYLITLGGNMTIIVLIYLDLQLQTPMYFFLSNLSIMDMSFTTITLHKILLVSITGDHIISFLGCMTQMYFFIALAGDELTILTAMSYDRYVAICNPLRYPVVMNRRDCILLVIFCWVMGFLESLPYLCLISNFSCYRSNEINHYFCDIVPLMKLTCSDTSVLELYILTGGIFLAGLIPSLLTVVSYIFIIATIWRINSSLGRRKAFYTCSSHLTVVILLYVTLFCQYLRPVSKDSLNSKKLLSFFNTVAVPVLNPLIYSLKNKDVNSAMRRRLRSCKLFI